MSKILLISPPFYRLLGSHFNGMSIGLSYISSILIQNGHKSIIYNADYYDSDHYLDQSGIFNEYDNYKKILTNLNHPIWKEICQVIRNIQPDYIGIQVYTGTFKSAQIIAKFAKEIIPEVKIVVGGTHPTLDPEGSAKVDLFDYIVRGEGEYIMLDIVSGKDLCQIDGLTFKDKNGNIINNKERRFIENLDLLPFPSRNSYYYGNGNLDIGSIVTSRGCPCQCTYCASPQIWKRKVRYRSTDNVLEELKSLVNNHKISLVRFQDDTFTLNKNHARDLCEKMIEHNLNTHWVCDTRIDGLDKEILQLMKKAGCVRIKVGVESGSDNILKKIQKGISVDTICKVINLIKEVEISLTVYYMIGFPDETENDVIKTIQLAEKLNADYNSLSFFVPYFGTKIYQELKESGYNFCPCNWEYFYHQSKEMVINTSIPKYLIDKFCSLSDKGKANRI